MAFRRCLTAATNTLLAASTVAALAACVSEQRAPVGGWVGTPSPATAMSREAKAAKAPHLWWTDDYAARWPNCDALGTRPDDVIASRVIAVTLDGEVASFTLDEATTMIKRAAADGTTVLWPVGWCA